MCHDAPCSGACKAGIDTAAVIRSLRLDNARGAGGRLRAEDPEGNACASSCPSRRLCELACTRMKTDRPVRISELLKYAASHAPKSPSNADISADILGVRCGNPFLLASSPVAGDDVMTARALEAGWGGIVYKTIGFFIADECSPRFDAVRDTHGRWTGFRNLEQISDKPLDENLENIARLKKRFPDKVIIASIMGRDEDEWRKLAVMAEQAGADLLEGNFSCPQMTEHGMGSDVGTSPELVAKYTSAAVNAVRIPFMAKMTPNITDITVPAAAAVRAGARGIAAINTIKSITSIDLVNMAANPSIAGRSSVSGYSGAAVKPPALRFVSELALCAELQGVHISGIGGIETWRDAAEFIALGCRSVQISTAVMQYGYRIIDDLVSGLRCFLSERGMSSLTDLAGAALPGIVRADELDRSFMLLPEFDAERCTGCGRCFISCSDAGHRALKWDAERRRPSLNGRCTGCGLCVHVCPCGCIAMSSERKNKNRC